MRAAAECFVIMGAAVKADGTPSGAMRRRVETALALGQNLSAPRYLVTGGQGRFGPPEAEVMRSMLRLAGVAEEQILTDPHSKDTLASIFACTSILKQRDDLRPVVVCTDRYHVARCRWLFWLLGIMTVKKPMLSGRAANGTMRWIYYYLREWAAMPWDTLALLGRRIFKVSP